MYTEYIAINKNTIDEQSYCTIDPLTENDNERPILTLVLHFLNLLLDVQGIVQTD